MSLNIGFYTCDLNARGTAVAIYNYAKYNETILGNKSIIFYDKTSRFLNKTIEEQKSIATSDDGKKRFEDFFEYVIPLEKFSDIDLYIEIYNIKVLFNEKAGENDGCLSKLAKNVIHCVFNCNQLHGDVYTSISKWVHNNNGQYPVIPYIVDLPEHNDDMREELGIPKDALVFGRHGGYEQFDIKYVQEAVYEFAKENPNVYFIFLSTKKFCPDIKNIIYLDIIFDLYEKRRFINSCDAMIWARHQGETFGLAIAEFSISNKPVIVSPIGDPAHIHLLGNKGLWYNNKDEVLNIFKTFDRDKVKLEDWNCYRDFYPEPGIRIFEEIAIKKALNL